MIEKEVDPSGVPGGVPGGVQKPSLDGAKLQVYRDNPQPLQPWRRTRKMEACHLPPQHKDSCWVPKATGSPHLKQQLVATKVKS